MDLRLLSKDHAVTVAVCDDTLTEIRYTTLKDTTICRRFRIGYRIETAGVHTRGADLSATNQTFLGFDV